MNDKLPITVFTRKTDPEILTMNLSVFVQRIEIRDKIVPLDSFGNIYIYIFFYTKVLILTTAKAITLLISIYEAVRH